MSRPIVAAAAAAAALVVGPAVAHASWWFTYTCTGRCAPNELAIERTYGPYATEADCDTARSGRGDLISEGVAPGNLGGLSFCQQTDAAPSSGGGYSSSGPTRPAPVARLMLSLVGGDSWQVRDASGLATTTGRTLGVDAGMHIGGHPSLGIEMSIGAHHVSMDAAPLGGPTSMVVVPILVGFTSTPSVMRAGASEIRLDLGADFGLLFRSGCDACDTAGLPGGAFLGELRGGLDVYFGRGKNSGVGLDAVLMLDGKMQNLDDPLMPNGFGVQPPQLLFRLTLISRHRRGVAW